VKRVLSQRKNEHRHNACFQVIDAVSGKPSLFYDAAGAYQDMGEEARREQRDFARRLIKLKQDNPK